MLIWIAWQGRGPVICGCCTILITFIIILKNIKLDYSKKNLIAFFVFFISRLYIEPYWGVSWIYKYLLLFIICVLPLSYKRDCILYITKWFSILMIPALIIHLVTLYTSLPSFGNINFIDGDLYGDTGYGIAKNYIFDIESAYSNYSLRFNGPFLEPGHLGMIGALLLFVNNFDLTSKYNKIIFFSVLASLSLAGYVLLLIGFIIYLYYRRQIAGKKILMFFLFFCGLYFYGIYYNNGNNVIYNEIIDRIEFSEDGSFIGDNRTFGSIPILYESLWTDTNLLLFGYDNDTIQYYQENGSRGTGYVMWMVAHGLLGTIVALASYLIVALFSSNKRYSLTFFMFIVIVFWQRSYPFWISWIICYLYGINIEENVSSLSKPKLENSSLYYNIKYLRRFLRNKWK